MEEGLKKRLIGAAVLASLAVIFVPCCSKSRRRARRRCRRCRKSRRCSDFASDMLREEVPAVTPLAPRAEEPMQSRTNRRKAQRSRAPGCSAWVVQVGSFSSQRERR